MGYYPPLETPKRVERTPRYEVVHFIYTDGKLDSVTILKKRAVYTSYDRKTYIKSGGNFREVHRIGKRYEWHQHCRRI